MTDAGLEQSNSATSENEASNAATAVIKGQDSKARGEQVDSDYLERFEKLAKRERELLAQRSKVKEIETKAQKAERLERLAKENPEELLEELGLDYNQLTQYFLNKNPQDEATKRVETLEQRLARLENEKAEQEKRAEDAKREQIMTSARDEIKRVVGESDEFELIRTMNRYDDVLDTCIEYFNRTGKYLSFEDAAVEVEKLLDEEFSPLINAKKIKSKIRIDKPQDAEDETQEVSTLSNSGMETSNSDGYVDEKELMRRAIAALKN